MIFDTLVWKRVVSEPDDYEKLVKASRTVMEEFLTAFREEMGVKDRLDQVQEALEQEGCGLQSYASSQCL